MIIVEYTALFYLFYKIYKNCFKTDHKNENVAIHGLIVHKRSNNDTDIYRSPNNNSEVKNGNTINDLKPSDNNYEMQIYYI